MVRQCHHQIPFAKVAFYIKAFNSIVLERRPFLKSLKKLCFFEIFDLFFGSLVPNTKFCRQHTGFFGVSGFARSTVSQTVLVNVQKHSGFQDFCFRPFNSIAVERCRTSISLVIRLLFQYTVDLQASRVQSSSFRCSGVGF